MSDLISRQAAIDALETIGYDFSDSGLSEIELEEICEAVGDVRQDMIDRIKQLPSAQPEQLWIPVTERLPEEDHWLGGSGKQFSDEVLVSVANYDDEDIWTYISQTIDGEWTLELPIHCKIIAWMPLPEPWKGEQNDDFE